MSNELQAMSLIDEIKQCHSMALDKLNEGFSYAIRCGELLTECKALLKAEGSTTFGVWTEQFLDFSPRTAQRYMKLHKDLGQLSNTTRLSFLQSADSISSLQNLLPQNNKSTRGDGDGGCQQKPDSSGLPPASCKPETVQPPPDTLPDPFDDEFPDPEPESGQREPRAGNGKPGAGGNGTPPKPDLGKCPNCAGTKWKDNGDGKVCSKCNHPHGEPAGDVDQDRIKIQRSKTVKTAEALMREFDDLNLLLPRTSQHATAISRCKLLLEAAKEWK